MKNSLAKLVIGLALAIVGILMVIQFKDLVAPIEDAAIIVADTTALESPIIDTTTIKIAPIQHPLEEFRGDWIAIASDNILEKYAGLSVVQYSPSKLIINGVETIFHKVEHQLFEDADTWTYYDEIMSEVAVIVIKNEVQTFTHYLGSDSTIKYYSNSKEEVDNFYNYHHRQK